MRRPNKTKLTLQARFSIATGISVVVFVVSALILFGFYYQVRSDIRQVGKVQLAQTVDSFRNTLDLVQFFARLKQLETNFYGNDEYLKQEGALLSKRVQRYEASILNSTLKTELVPIRDSLSDYLRQCARVNGLLAQLNRAEQGIDEGFVLLEDLAAERMLESSGGKDKAADYERLSLLIAGHRIAMLGIIQSNTRDNPEHFFGASFFDPSPNTASVTKLIGKLQALADAPEPIDRFGRYLIDQLKYYLHLSNRFQQEMIHLGRKSGQLTQLMETALQKMESFDGQLEKSSGQAVEQIDRRLLWAGGISLVLLFLPGMLLGLMQINLFRNHVRKPMMQVRKRLLGFEQGDHSSPMDLQRDDEWNQIEETFNAMLTALSQSWTAVQKSERRYRNFYNSAVEGIFQTTLEGKLLEMNPAMASMFGITWDANSSYQVDAREQFYVNPEDRDRLAERLLQEEMVSGFEVKMKRSNGETFWAVLNCHLVRDNAEDGLLLVEGTIEDNSLRRENEQALRQLKEYLHDIVDAMPSVLVGVDEQLKVTLWNRTIAELSGVSEAEVLEQPLGDVFLLVDNVPLQKMLEETLVSGEIERLQKIPGQGAGSGRFYDLMIYPLSSPEQIGAVIHMDDVTEKSRIEEVMVQSEKMLSIGSLAAGVAHEINNPLASVLQNVQVLRQRLSPALKKNQEVAEQIGIRAEQVAEYAQIRGLDKMITSIADAGQRVAHIIENMLNFSRQSRSRFIPHSLQELVEKTIELASSDYNMKHHFDFRAITILRDYQDVPDVPCEAGQIQQVILSLLKNAAQSFGKDNKNPQIHIHIFHEENEVCLQIEDNGVGMDEITRRRIFEPFYTTHEVGEGVGLGLSVAYFLIVENHKGSLTVESLPGKGSSFSVRLPLARS